MTPPTPDRSVMLLYAGWALSRMTLAEATAFVVSAHLKAAGGDVDAAARSLGVRAAVVREWTGEGSLYPARKTA